VSKVGRGPGARSSRTLFEIDAGMRRPFFLKSFSRPSLQTSDFSLYYTGPKRVFFLGFFLGGKPLFLAGDRLTPESPSFKEVPLIFRLFPQSNFFRRISAAVLTSFSFFFTANNRVDRSILIASPANVTFSQTSPPSLLPVDPQI